MSELNLSALGAFASGDDLHPREVTLGGSAHTVYVRRLPAIELRRFHEEAQSPDLDTRLNSGFRAVTKAIRQEDGKPHMTFEQAKTLKSDAMRELMRVFVDVNRVPDADELGNA